MIRNSGIIKTINTTLLCIKYPFLKYFYRRGKLVQKSCWYYAVEYGWRYIFLQMCEEIKRSMKRDKFPLDTFMIYDIKEKNGELDIDAGGPGKDIDKIIHKYEYISFRTCIRCGRPAYGYTTPWVEPYCDKCCNKDGLKPFYTEEDKWYGCYKHVFPETNKI